MSAVARPIIPARRSQVAAFLALDIMADAARRERDGASIVHMEVGEPCHPPPRCVREAAIGALAGGRVGYTEALGRPSLRARIARHYRDTYGVCVDAERIVVTTGSSGGFILALLTLFEAGARVAISTPGYPAYRNMFQALGLETVALRPTAEDRFVVTAAAIEAAHAQAPLDGVLLMSPANPSGTLMQPEALRDVCRTCDRLGIAFISDEIYHGLTYDMAADTALRHTQSATIVNSFSKYFCMTGWRIGWLVLPPDLVRPIERLQQNLSISVPTLSQVGAEAAFDAAEELESIKAGYARSRALLLDALPRLGLGAFHPPDGAFYLYVDITRHSDDATAFCARMLDEIGVAATPGLDFDPEGGGRSIRLSFAGAEAEMAEAVRRLRAWL